MVTWEGWWSRQEDPTYKRPPLEEQYFVPEKYKPIK